MPNGVNGTSILSAAGAQAPETILNLLTLLFLSPPIENPVGPLSEDTQHPATSHHLDCDHPASANSALTCTEIASALASSLLPCLISAIYSQTSDLAEVRGKSCHSSSQQSVVASPLTQRESQRSHLIYLAPDPIPLCPHLQPLFPSPFVWFQHMCLRTFAPAATSTWTALPR